ncbi:hypothetical protein [Dactylosporangium sp. NPDC051541]|uniref:hypothetical protein n=1 Tax=Dactylosporangium sp. NPDC051541 TaxID=3363977 RepID=UPI0037A89428
MNIKHWPGPLTDAERASLVDSLALAVSTAFHCDPGVVSIALEPVTPEQWQERVVTPEVVERRELLIKTPDYAAG